MIFYLTWVAEGLFCVREGEDGRRVVEEGCPIPPLFLTIRLIEETEGTFSASQIPS